VPLKRFAKSFHSKTALQAVFILPDKMQNRFTVKRLCKPFSYYRTKNYNMLILLKKRFAKSFYSKTALQAVFILPDKKLQYADFIEKTICKIVSQ